MPSRSKAEIDRELEAARREVVAFQKALAETEAEPPASVEDQAYHSVRVQKAQAELAEAESRVSALEAESRSSGA
jgi:hypothetical protein